MEYFKPKHEKKRIKNAILSAKYAFAAMHTNISLLGICHIPLYEQYKTFFQ